MRLAVLLVVLLVGGAGCSNESCLSGEASCTVASPCPKVAFDCGGVAEQLSIETIAGPSQRPGGWNAIGARGDVKLSNTFADVVIAGLGTQNYLDPNGGSVLDLAPRGQAKDSVNNIFQVVGILPGDAIRYTALRVIDERPERVAVELRGTLDGRKDVLAFTRYELRPCDRGVRVRTELINASNDLELWSLVDGYYWSGREALPFTPGAGSGFTHASFNLLTINSVFRTFPFLAAAGHSTDDRVSSIASTSCTASSMEGFNSDQVSAAGLPRTRVPPRGYLVFERFISVGDSKGVSGAIDVAMDVRRQVTKEAYATVKGKVERPMALALDSERTTSVLISEGAAATSPEQRSPWTQVVPAADGTFTARVPAGKNYVVEVHSFGRKVVEREFTAVAEGADFGTFVLPSTGAVTFQVRDSATMQGLDAEIFVVPVDAAEREKVLGSLHGRFTSCAPWLGTPAGASPACNRVLVRQGTSTAEVPLGRYYVYAFHGPWWSLGRDTVTVMPGASTVSLNLTRLAGLKPTGTITADFHIHGAASFDSSIPDFDRVLSFSASDLDVAVGTDHDVVYDYSKVVEQLGLSQRLSTVIGLETTGHIPFLFIPKSSFPLVIGHYNMWPLKYDPSLPRNGGPYDELVEPGMLFERTKPLFTGTPVIELNHPWAVAEFGRDLGFPRALAMDLRQDLPAADDGTNLGIYVRTPQGASFSNHGHHAQEVMNGTDNGLFLQYRAFWWYVLNQGHRKVGTANSDSHSLTDNTVGMPFNLVTAATQSGPAFDVNVLNRAVLDGRSLGSNGPVIEATIEDASGVARAWSTTTFAPKADAKVRVKVTSAPWIPVQEVRFVVNGQIVKTLKELPLPADPFATSGSFVRYEGEVPLAELLAGVTGDAWLSIEAGKPLMLAGDLGGGQGGAPDGMPDTTDNNGDGKVDASDVSPATSKIGPIADPPLPKEGEAGFDFANITLGYPLAFTNPFFLDRNGDGEFTAPGAKGGR
ncbi:MAG: CehA/McbA family metallohydrolase [Myxococcaceae bacterium]|nr:CehA/McbA family metallohydrolase [Myxococcaceae bacterium]